MENHISKLGADLLHKINTKTKPFGALGALETTAYQIGMVQNTLSPALKNPYLLLFAGDHGVTASGVSAYPQAVTAQMMFNFVGGGAAVNVFARQNGLKLMLVDAGVNAEFPVEMPIRNEKVGFGTQNFVDTLAMSMEQVETCLTKGANIVKQIASEGCNVVGFGEMGIGNTSSAAMLMHFFTQKPLVDCVGRGTGLDDKGLQTKLNALQEALYATAHQTINPKSNFKEILAHFGGFELAMMAGAMQEAFKQNMLLLIDGFIVTAALMAIYHADNEILKNCIFAHTSGEHGHQLMLDFLGVKPLLNLQMRLGEGTGVALAYPLVQASVNFLNEMASFESAGVSEKSDA